MPYGDRTGPMGFGPMTGRRGGYCVGYNMPGFANPIPPRGYGFWGGGRGWRRQFYATGLPGWRRAGYTPPTAEQELGALKAESAWLQDQLEAIKQRIAELEQEK